MADLLEKNQQLIIYFDLYGPLLTEKQQQYFELYYFDDLSLAEIATAEDVSRNAVFDALKKATTLLYNYEEKLKLYERDQEVMKLLNELKKHTDPKGQKIIEQLENEY